jgi:hypothetical protein
MKLLKSEEWYEDMGGRIFVKFERKADGSIEGAPIDVCFANGYIDEYLDMSEYTHFIDDNCNSLFSAADPESFPVDGKKEMLKKICDAEKAAHEYFVSCDVGMERDQAYEVYQNIRLSTRVG